METEEFYGTWKTSHSENFGRHKKGVPGPLPVNVTILDESLPAPKYATAGSAGLDLRAAGLKTPLSIAPGERVKIGSGLAMHLSDPSFVGLVFPRSGLGSRGLVLANGTGVIDSDYTGEIVLCLVNTGNESIEIAPYDRIAQLVVMPVVRVAWTLVDTLDTTERGKQGFGSTGKV